MDRISNLPREILYNILYFLSKKEAAQTCVLSKSWRFLWTNRLTLSYSEGSSLFSGPHRTRLFIHALQSRLDNNIIINTIHRIDEFHLVVNSSDSVSLLENWIPILTSSIGVKELFLSILPIDERLKYPYTFDLSSSFFESKSLTSLHLSRCILSSLGTNIRFVRLNVLRLHNVKFGDEHTFEKIVSSCLLITTMRLVECEGLKTVKLVRRNKHLKHFTFINENTHNINECLIEIRTRTLETISIIGSKIRFHSGVHEFGNLKKLCLRKVRILRNSFDCSSCYRFPRLGMLSFINCYGWERLDQMPLRISAPKILYFQHVGTTIPPITFTKRMPRQCISNIVVKFCRRQPADESWFVKVSGLLQVLSRSKIFLSFIDKDPMHNNNIPNNIDSVVVRVEELGLNIGRRSLSSFSCLLNCMFSICRPMKIVQHSYVGGGESEKQRDGNELTQFLTNFLRTKKKDLKKLTIESFDTSREQWERVPLSEYALLPETGKRTRFRLKWTTTGTQAAAAAKIDILLLFLFFIFIYFFTFMF